MIVAVRCCLLLLIVCFAELAMASEGKRSYRINDYIETEEIGASTFAPDTRAVAFTRRRAASTQITNGLAIGEILDDVWLQDAPGRPVRNLTQGAADGSGWWSPRWSPDGERLAMLSSRGGLVQLWIWERATEQLRQVTQSGVDFASFVGDNFYWLDNRHLIYVSMPPDDPATVMGKGGPAVGKSVERAEAAWSKAKRGEMTASAVSSFEFRLSRRKIAVSDVRGQETIIGETVCNTNEHNGAWWGLSPDGKVVMLQRPESSSYGGIERSRLGLPGKLELRSLEGEVLPFDRPLPANVVLESVRWSPDGSEFAFFALEERRVHPELLFDEGAPWVRYPEVTSREYPGRLWRANVRTGQVEQVDTGDIDLGRAAKPLGSGKDSFGSMSWAQEGGLLFHASRLSKRPQSDVSATRDWLLLGRDGRVSPGTESMAVTGRTGETTQRQQFEQRVRPPTADAKLVAFSQLGKTAIYQADNRTGTFLWRIDAHGQAEQLLATNTSRAHVRIPEQRLITYKDSQGKPRRAVLTFPYGFKKGQKVPVVLISDTSYTHERTPSKFELRSSTEWITWFDGGLATAGYALLWAEMPVDEMGRGRDGTSTNREDILSYTKGILPAVEAVVGLGVADPERVFLYGASSMGFGVFGLVTQTDRFTAAIAQAPHRVDLTLTALYPSSGYINRYSDNPFPSSWIGAFRNGLPFWRDGDFLRRNSPIHYVDRVQTPLMIIHGDLDERPLLNSELFFGALAQQRKPAELVRYFGEGHQFRTPANIRDNMQRILAWFDQWGDIARDTSGNILYGTGGNVKSRNGAPAWTVEDYGKLDLFRSSEEARRQPLIAVDRLH